MSTPILSASAMGGRNIEHRRAGASRARRRRRERATARPGARAYIMGPARARRPEAAHGMIDPTELVLNGWPSTDADWSWLIDANSIPPAMVRRAVVFDGHDPLLAELTLPAGTVS